MKKRILWGILIVLVIIQFFRPAKNSGETYGPNDITKTVEVSADVKNILDKACNDCHSDHTEYPWYTNIQPVGWWLANHVNEGKDELNFSQFNTYKLRRKLHKLEEITEQVKEDEMPPAPYVLMHGDAKLSEQEKELLITWALMSKTLLDTVKVVSAQEKK